jgi:hypothetical protein
MAYSAGREFLRNLRSVPRHLRESLVRHGRPTSDRARTQTVVQNFFLHIHPARIHNHSLKWCTTMGLGIMTVALFLNQRYREEGMAEFLPKHRPILEEMHSELDRLLADRTGTMLFRMGMGWRMKNTAVRMPMESFID